MKKIETGEEIIHRVLSHNNRISPRLRNLVRITHECGNYKADGVYPFTKTTMQRDFNKMFPHFVSKDKRIYFYKVRIFTN